MCLDLRRYWMWVVAGAVLVAAIGALMFIYAGTSEIYSVRVLLS